MRYRALGGLDVVDDDGRTLDLGAPKQRAVLGLLLVDANRVVSVDRLTDALWGDEPPARSSASLQAYISNLRRALEPERRPRDPARVLVTRAPGYVLVVDRPDLDLTSFEDLVAAGRARLADGDPTGAAVELDRALALWGGPPLPELAGEAAVREVVARCESLRATAWEGAFEARLALGRHAEAIPALEAAVVEHPLREHLWAQLAVALYRSGRQSEALRVLGDARRTLADEVGLDPGPELRHLETAILAQDPELDHVGPSPVAPAPAAVPGPAPTAPPPPAPDPGPVAAGPGGGRPWQAGTSGDGRGFVGRVGELDALLRAAAAAVAGTGTAIVVSGEPGIGKTRLVEELAARCASDGIVVAWGRCPEGGVAPSFWPCRQIGEQLRAAGVIDGHLLDQVEPFRPHGEHTATTGAGDTMPGHPTDRSPVGVDAESDASADRFTLHLAVSQALAATRRPLLLVVDDVQWADPASLRLVEFVAGELRGLPVLLVVTTRPTGAGSPPALVDCLAELARQPAALRVDLTGLAPEAVADWMGRRAEGAVSAPVVAFVHDRTGGNPFFVQELVELLVSERRLDDPDPTRAARAVPAAVQDVVRRRVARLPTATQQLLTTASVIGRGFDLDVLAHVDDRPLLDVLDLLDAACASGLVVEDGEAPGRFRFSHALVAETLAAELTAARRARVHATVARSVEMLRAADPDDHLATVAHHAFAGAAAGTAELAYEYSVRAARQAAARVAPDDAADHWTRALAALDLARPGDRRTRYETLLQLGIARLVIDETSVGVDALLAAIDLAFALDDVEAAVRAAVRLNHTSLWGAHDYLLVSNPTIEHLERVLAALPADDDRPEQARILGALAVELAYTDQAERIDATSLEAVAVARRSGDASTRVLTLHNRYQIAWRPQNLSERQAIAEEMIELDREGTVPDDLGFLTWMAAALVAYEVGDPEGLARAMVRARATAERCGHPVHLHQLGWLEATLLLSAGRFDEAVELAMATGEAYRRTRRGDAEVVLGAYLVFEAFERARFDVLDLVLETDPGSYAVVWTECIAWVMAASGRLDDARALLGPPGVPPGVRGDYLWLAAKVLGTHARLDVGDLEGARRLAAELVPHAGTLALTGSAGIPAGPVDLALARMAWADDDQERAHALMTAAIELIERMGVWSWLPRALVARAGWRRDSPDEAERRAGRDDLDRATAMARELGMVNLLQQLGDG